MNRTIRTGVLASVFAAGLAIAAVPQTTYTTGQPLTAAGLNADFEEVESRLTTLEADPASDSTTEQDTGRTWIDGKPIFRKVILIPAGPNGSPGTPGVVDIPHGITFESIVSYSGGLYGNAGNFVPVPYKWVAVYISMGVQATTLQLLSETDYSAESGHMVLEYTKP